MSNKKKGTEEVLIVLMLAALFSSLLTPPKRVMVGKYNIPVRRLILLLIVSGLALYSIIALQ